MAKKRKKKNSDVGPEHELPGGFWHQVLAVVMIALAVILVMTWFGSGGSLLNHIHSASQWLIGYAAYFIPLLLVYLAVKIFRSDTNRLPIVVWLASVLMVLWLAGIFGIPTIGLSNPTGGVVGEGLNLALTQILDSGVVVFIYIVLIFITAIFIMQISPAAVFRAIINLFRGNQKEEDADNAKVARAAEAGEKLELKVNPGVAIAEATTPKVKASDAKKSSAAEPPRALTSVSDPDWKMPPIDLLDKTQSPADAGNIQQNALIIKNTFAEFGIDVEMEGANVGPRVTQYTLRAPGGINLAKIAARDKELAYKLSAQTVRIEAPIPGTQLIGVEVPNAEAAMVSLRGIIESKEWEKSTAQLTFSVGKNISGKPIIADLANMPHLLIAGTTGSGKSVMTNSLIMSLLYRNSPSDMRLIIVDPKRVEMVNYNDIPHLLTPVISDTAKALSAIKWATGEMDRRYKLMAEEKVKKISDYNAKMERLATKATKEGDESSAEQEGKSKMPYIVIIIDEMSDLMMQASKELEPLIVRIAQLGRAAGMHLVLATQKPVVKVITGLIKGNIPSRIAFRVLTSMESRIILDVSGAEKLLGDGDMLFSTEKTMNGPERIQGAYTPDEDIEKVTNFLREQRAPDYNDEVISQAVAVKGLGGADGDMGEFGRKFDPNDPFVRQAVQLSINAGRFATSHLQANMRKGHGWVAGLAIWLEQIGVIGPINGTKPREVLITSMEEFDELANGQ